MNRPDDGFVGESTRSVHEGVERDKFAQSLIDPIAQTGPGWAFRKVGREKRGGGFRRKREGKVVLQKCG